MKGKKLLDGTYNKDNHVTTMSTDVDQPTTKKSTIPPTTSADNNSMLRTKYFQANSIAP